MSESNTSDSNSSVLAERLANKNENPASNVAQWLEDVHHGTLCTISSHSELEGFPYGSIVPFAISSDGMPYILIAEIAAHTKNILTNSKSCLFISHPNPKGDPQSNWRASIFGEFERVITPSRKDKFNMSELEKCIHVSEEEEERMLVRYCQRVPSAKSYLETHNFYFWKMKNIEKVRYIAGFGKICWINGDEVEKEISDIEIQNIKVGSIEHMNDDHEDAMITICQGIHDFSPKTVKMIDLDCGGIMMHSNNPERMTYTPFEKRIKADDLRVEIINLVKKSRKLLSTS
ncbi:MAG: hypothetical protein CMB56_006590 [Methanobacteriota archaeon]|nr:MAG: hypothetical protein CMB56_006590 [Euryarchaeota archaeon]|tara:strand:+ start:14357 stop:15223 length:867 start_codon:yes stop_codon:yes gene_type:complete